MRAEAIPDGAERRLQELRALYDLSLAAASLDPGSILQLIGEQISRLFGAAAFFVALVDEEHDALHFAHFVDRGQIVPPFTVPLSEEGALTHYVLRTAQPLLVADLLAPPPGLPATPVVIGEISRAWLGVPLVVKGRAIGVMSVQSYTPGAFDEDDQRLLSLAAQQAAAALENARLYQQTLALERRYHALLEALDDGYAVVESGQVVFANTRLGQMLGSTPGELLAESLGRLATPATAETVHHRTRLTRRDGSELPVELTLSHIEYEGQPALAVLCRDVSRQARLEAQLVQAEKLSAVGELVSGVAHELNNPLTTIKGYAQLLQGEQVSPAVVEDLKKVEEAADRCRRIVRDLLTFARRYEPECSDTDVNELLQRTVALRSYELRVRSVAVQWALDPCLPVIQADPHRLQQVILALIFNAEQAILGAAEEGQITIHSSLAHGGNHIRFEVTDSGPGIRPEHMARIFDPFFTTKPVGTGAGLGLSTAYGIVKEHSGRIWAENRPGEGATFVVELPIAGDS
ncbi:MAG TPA: GAF domain-containing protein [Anaerolineae bacterium]|nr:GAF domain-containing protein [Anaerolineae bacterium]HOQ99010.1 GAF domain-containing protein [Anaerolineae bacterium]HPL29914.1 GAF domain-containing protein [Anaerolineae bacterium]